MRTIEELIENIRSGSSSAHAYIIEGRAKSGRDGMTESLIKGLGCHSLDVVRMQMSGKNSYKTEDAAAFAERLEMGAYGSCLVGVIEEADLLTEVVQNKLLKTLEEPRGSVIILLGTSNRDNLLDTVRSRCSVLRTQDFEIPEAADDGESEAKTEEIRDAAKLMLDGESAFSDFRAAIEKCIKTRSDALMLIDMLEDDLMDRMTGSDDPAKLADHIETAERTRMDIQRDMDKNKALKRLRLELVRA